MKITAKIMLDRFNDMLNECNPEAMGFLPSTILRNCDPIAYRCAFVDYVDSEGIDPDSLDDYYTLGL
jgi:hypothetical protein